MRVKSNFDNLAASLCCMALMTHGGYINEIVDDNHCYQPFKDIFSHHSDQQLTAVVPPEYIAC